LILFGLPLVFLLTRLNDGVLFVQNVLEPIVNVTKDTLGILQELEFDFDESGVKAIWLNLVTEIDIEINYFRT